MINIGIVGKSWDDGQFGVRTDYVKLLSQVGMVTIITPTGRAAWSNWWKNYQVVVLPGGADISPDRYGAVPDMETGDQDVMLDYFDNNLLLELMSSSNKTTLVMGICRGCQSLAVELGLHNTQWAYFAQDLPYHPHSTAWGDLAHGVMVYDQNTPWKRQVNSLHHQGMVVAYDGRDDLKKNPGVHILALEEPRVLTAKLEGTWLVLEAFETAMTLGVQWHPEAINDPLVLKWIRTKLDKGWVTP